MNKDDEIYLRHVKTAMNHKLRAEEGRNLINDGRSLNEMKTPIEGLSQQQLLEVRQEEIDSLEKKSKDDLLKLLKMVEAQIEHRLSQENQGTSELYWKRIVIKEILKI